MSFTSSPSLRHFAVVAVLATCLLQAPSLSNAQLSPFFYAQTCPGVFDIVRGILRNAFSSDQRIGASIIRLHFHDCFVQGCDASILLDNSSTIVTEKDAAPNVNSVRGFEVIDAMKAALELVCPRTVSCADIVTIASAESVVLSGGPAWMVPVGRRDSLTANKNLANTNLPSPFSTLDQLKDRFANVGLNRSSDLVALSGAHTFGRARCIFVVSRIFNFNNTGQPDPTLDPAYRDELRRLCPQGGDNNRLINLDLATPDFFDSAYFTNLQHGRGLLRSDQVLFSTPGADTANLVNLFSQNTGAFFASFVQSMIRMGNITPLTGTQGEIRRNCRVVNGRSSENGGLVSSA